jgi:hypothetical protein
MDCFYCKFGWGCDEHNQPRDRPLASNRPVDGLGRPKHCSTECWDAYRQSLPCPLGCAPWVPHPDLCQ